MAFDLLDQVVSSLAPRKISIEEFSEGSNFCDKPLYPRQRLFLKLIFLEELTGKEEDVLNYWIAGGRNGTEVVISPDIRERIQWLRENGYDHFREVDLIGGRRASKGFITGIAMAKVLYDCLQLEDPGGYYGIDPTKDIYFSCVAGSEDQAKKFQYADFSSTVEGCKAFERHLARSLETEFRISTAEDMKRAAQLKARSGGRMVKDFARLRGNALAANAGTLRGSATLAIVIDEMSHMLPGSSKASADEVYKAATPALDQFGNASIIFCNPPEAPVWMADLSFKPIGEVEIGDRVVGWRRPEGKMYRDLCDSEVTNVVRRQSPIIKVTMESGRMFRCTPDHKWLTLSSGGSTATHGGEWYAPAKEGRKLAHVVDPTPQLDPELLRDAAWLGGIFDKEGYAARAKQITICQSRNVNPKVCERIESTLTKLGFDWIYHPIRSKLGEGGAYHILGGKQVLVDFANWTKPAQLHKLQDKAMTAHWRKKDRVAFVEEDGFGEVVALTTTTGNYVCNGYASKNCNSSPWTKVGMFYERVREAMKPLSSQDDPDGGNPRVMAFQYPSWALFDGYQEDEKNKWYKAVTVSPDWDPDEKLKDGKDKWSGSDKSAIATAIKEEQANPDSYKVERRAKFAEVSDAYLNPDLVDRMYMGIPDGYEIETDPDTGLSTPSVKLTPLLHNYGAKVHNYYRYKAHLDPSSTTAGFGFAMGHVEEFPDYEGNPSNHVVFDIIKRWDPKTFPGSVIRWDPILAEVVEWAEIFRPFEITMDQHQSSDPIQDLQERLNARNISCRVYMKWATNEDNWKRAETFKTALYQGLIHAPNDTPDAILSSWELKFLQQKATGGRFPRVDKQDSGPVTTKDISDSIIDVVETLIGNQMATRARDRLAQSSMALGAQGGFGIGNTTPMSPTPPGLEGLYRSRRTGEQSRAARRQPVTWNTDPGHGARLGRGRGNPSRW